MSYRVLARKYRPDQLDQVVGQEHVVEALSNALSLNRLHHAYLFTGTRGVGKTTLARILAKCLSCEEGIAAISCSKCDACLEISDGTFVDLIEIDAASRTGVDDTRAMLENVQYMPTKGRFKIYLIDEVHMLSVASFNALLKTLEEPPEHVKFILATTNPQRVLPTVLSRCLQFHLRNISPEEVANHLSDILQKEKITFDQGALNAIAKASQGSMRDGLSITDQAIARCGEHLDVETIVDMLGTARTDEVTLLLSTLVDGDRKRLFEVISDLAGRSVDFSDVMNGLETAMHDLAMAVAAQIKPPVELEPFESSFEPDWLQSAYQILIMGSRDLQYAPSPQIGFEMTMIRLLDFMPLGENEQPVETPVQPVTTQPVRESQTREPRPAPTQTRSTESRPLKTEEQDATPSSNDSSTENIELPDDVRVLKETFDAEITRVTPLEVK